MANISEAGLDADLACGGVRMSLRGQDQRNELRLSDYLVAGKQGNVMYDAGRRNDLVGWVGAEIESDRGP